MNRWRVLVRLELRQLGRVAAFWLAVFAVLAAGVLAVISGASRVDQQRAVLAAQEPALLEQAAHLRQMVAADDDLGLLFYYLAVPVAQEPSEWAALSVGLSDVHPQSRQLRFTGLVPQLYQTEVNNPLRDLAGRFDFGFVLVFLLPLFIIGISYDVCARDDDLGTHALVRSQPTPASRVVALRLGVRFAVASSLALALLIFAAAWLKIPWDLRLASFALATFAYVSIWFLGVWVVGGLRRSSAFNAILLVGGWISACVLLPALINLAFLTASPVRGGVELTLAQRQEMNAGWDKPKRATLDPFFARRPEWSSTEVPEDRFSWPWYYAMHEMGDAHVAAQVREYDASLAARARWTARVGLVLPPLSFQLFIDRLAGADLRTALAHRESIADYHERLRQALYRLIFRNESVSAFELDALPRHRFTASAKPPGAVDLGGLFVALAVLGVLAAGVRRRLDGATAKGSATLGDALARAPARRLEASSSSRAGDVESQES